MFQEPFHGLRGGRCRQQQKDDSDRLSPVAVHVRATPVVPCDQPALVEVWHGRDRNHILATVLCVGLAFTAYNLFSAINRRLANGKLAAWLLGKPSPEEIKR